MLAVGDADGAELEPLSPELRPRARLGRHRPEMAIDRQRRAVEGDPRVLDRHLRRVGDPVGRLRHGPDGAVLDTVQRGHQQACSGHREPVQEFPGGVGGFDELGDGPEHRARVELPHDPERRGAGDLVTGPDRRLDRRGATPGGQQGEVQVDPAVTRHRESGLRQQRAVGDDGAGIRRQLGQPGQEVLVTGTPGGEDLDAVFVGEGADRGTHQSAPSARGRVGTGDDGDDVMARRVDQRA